MPIDIAVDFAAMNWMAVEEHIRHDIRVVMPLGATEEHGYLSLASDTIFVDYVTRSACDQTGVLRTPALPFGCSAFAVNFPGTISLRAVTMCHLLTDVVDCLYRQGFRRMVFVTGHGGNEVITGLLSEVQIDRPQLAVYYLNAWDGMRNAVRELADDRGLGRAEHASWTESQPETRVAPIPAARKDFADHPDFPIFPLNPRTARHFLGDGVVSGVYDLNDDELLVKLRQSCADHIADYLRKLPATPPHI
jgi:creatinine amidohydrolase